MPSISRAFRKNAKNFFLTYPQCPLSLHEALDQLQHIQTAVNKKFIKVCKEQHESGEPHLHALVQFEGKFQFTNARQFDLRSPSSSAIYHPNIQGAKSSSDVKQYIEKNGDTIEWGSFQIDGRSARGGQQSANDAYAEALNSNSAAAALQVIKEKVPKDYVLRFHKLNANLQRIFATPSPKIEFKSKWAPNSFQIPNELQSWRDTQFEEIAPAGPQETIRFKLRREIYRPMSLILEGPLRLGKTQWARSLGKHNYLSGHLDFNHNVYSNEVEYNVIDDVKPDYLKLKHWKELIGAQHDWQANCKYRKPIQIKGGIPTIILCNPGEGSSYQDFLSKSDNSSLKDWTLKNAIFISINEALFRTQSQSEDYSQSGQEERPEETRNQLEV